MKFYGAIGFQESMQEVRPGVYRDGIVERMYSGDYNRVSRSFQSSQQLSDNLTLNAELSFIADNHAFRNLNNIRYVVIRGTKWKVTSIDDTRHPRVVLTIGGEYNDTGGSQA